MRKITETKDLVPGKLYGCFTVEFDYTRGEEYDRSGALVWYAADGTFYDAETDEPGHEVRPDCDFFVEQVGAFNADYAH